MSDKFLKRCIKAILMIFPFYRKMNRMEKNQELLLEWLAQHRKMYDDHNHENIERNLFLEKKINYALLQIDSLHRLIRKNHELNLNNELSISKIYEDLKFSKMDLSSISDNLIEIEENISDKSYFDKLINNIAIIENNINNSARNIQGIHQYITDKEFFSVLENQIASVGDDISNISNDVIEINRYVKDDNFLAETNRLIVASEAKGDEVRDIIKHVRDDYGNALDLLKRIDDYHINTLNGRLSFINNKIETGLRLTENDPAIIIKALREDTNISSDLLIDYVYGHRRYSRIFKELPNLKQPRTFNEKIQYWKLFNRDDSLTSLADKFTVRNYVKETIGEKYLTPLLWVGEDPDEIPYNDLPTTYYIKVNHSWNMFIHVNEEMMKISREKESKKINKDVISSTLKEWLDYNYYFHTREWQYKNIKPKVLIEQAIGLENEVKREFQFFCFDGVPKFFKLFSEKGIDKSFYDMDMNLLPIDQSKFDACILDHKPDNFDEMVHIAQELSKKHSHVRIDLYNIDEKQIYFSECTFTSGDGISEHYHGEWGKLIGDMWEGL